MAPQSLLYAWIQMRRSSNVTSLFSNLSLTSAQPASIYSSVNAEKLLQKRPRIMLHQ